MGNNTIKSMSMIYGLSRASGYLAMEGVRVFLREGTVWHRIWEDRTATRIYQGIDSPCAEDVFWAWRLNLRKSLGIGRVARWALLRPRAVRELLPLPGTLPLYLGRSLQQV